MSVTKVYVHPLSERVHFIQACMMVGFVWLSTSMSKKLRCGPESYSLLEGMQNSPALRKPKKHVVYAAHAIMLLRSSSCFKNSLVPRPRGRREKWPGIHCLRMRERFRKFFVN